MDRRHHVFGEIWRLNLIEMRWQKMRNAKLETPVFNASAKISVVSIFQNIFLNQLKEKNGQISYLIISNYNEY